MEEFKRMNVWELLMFLQNRVRNNANEIKENNNAINGVDSSVSVTPELLQAIKKLTHKNASLTAENSKFLNLFNILIEFHKQYKQKLIGNLEDLRFEAGNYKTNYDTYEECLEKTLKGQMELNTYHPYINDKEFLRKLMDAWSKSEEFEKCAEVQEILNAINN